MIQVTMPVLKDPVDQEAVRKALLNLADQLNRELMLIDQRLKAIETP